MSKLPFAIIDGSLMAYNGKCYDYIKKEDLVRIYCEKVDPTLGDANTMTQLYNTYGFMKASQIGLPVIEDVSNLHMVVLQNGIYDCDNKRLIRHSPDIYATSYINANYIEIGKAPKTFDRFLQKTFDNDPVLIDLAYYVIGYMLMQSNELKVFFFMGRAGNSGKSIFGNFLQQLYPKAYRNNIPLSSFNTQFGLQTILGSATNFSLELPNTVLNEKSVSILKNLCGGGDGLQIDIKLQAPVAYRNRAKLMFASNFPLKIKGSDPAFWERVVYLPFTKTVPAHERNPKLMDAFMKEKDLIVAKAIRYACDFVANGMVFPTHPLIETTLSQWAGNEIPTVELFLEEKCEIGSKFRGEKLETLYQSYKTFCSELELTPIKKTELNTYLQNIYNLEYKKIYIPKAERIDDERAFDGIAGIKLTA